MGYNTRYELDWKDQNSKGPPSCSCKAPKGEFCSKCGRSTKPTGLDELIGDYIEEHENMSYALARNGSAEESCKWYEHEEDMRAMSKEFPGVLLHLHGEGEEAGDIWDGYALDGKWQKRAVEIVKASIDPEAWT